MEIKTDIYKVHNVKVANTTLEDLKVTKSKNYRSSFPTFDVVAIYIEDNDEKVIRHAITCENVLARSYPRVEIEKFSPSGNANAFLYLGLDEMHIDDYKRDVILEKTKEMTIEEIEKALGHKVKIVKEHNNV